MGSSGNAVHRIFCSECGSPIAHDPDVAPDIIAMKAGTLDMEIKKKLKPVSAHKHSMDESSGLLLTNGIGYRDLDRVEAAILQGELGPSFRAYALMSYGQCDVKWRKFQVEKQCSRQQIHMLHCFPMFQYKKSSHRI